MAPERQTFIAAAQNSRFHPTWQECSDGVLDGYLHYAEELKKNNPKLYRSQKIRKKLLIQFRDELGIEMQISRYYLNGGPNTRGWGKGEARRPKARQFARVIIHTLNKLGLGKLARDFFITWQASKKKKQRGMFGAVGALSLVGRGVTLRESGTEHRNIKPSLWNEILTPGSIIQTWRTRKAARTRECPKGLRQGGVCGHSFIFVEYVYSTKPNGAYLFGESGKRLNRRGREMPRSKIRMDPSRIGSLYLVGVRIADQNGYHFVPRNPQLAKKGSLTEWLARSEVWYASQLV